MTLAGAKQRLKQNKETIVNHADIIDRLTKVRDELVAVRKELDYVN